MTNTTALSIALGYAARNWPVFPCRAADEETGDHDPETGELIIRAVKTPYTGTGFKAATKRDHILQRWWTDWPDAMIGVPTGEPIGAWVLDIDPRHGGEATLAALEAEHAPLPRTRIATTASGGRHYYFRHVAGVRNRGNLGPGIDVRGDGGYVIAPGSATAAGGLYAWADECEPAEAPQWLLDMVLRRPPPQQASGPGPALPRTGHNPAYVHAAVERELSDLAATPMGNRNNALNDASFALGQFVGAGALSRSEAEALLENVARGWGRDWAKCVKTIGNGLGAGIMQPRKIPQSEFGGDDNTRLIDVTRMIEAGLRKAREQDALAADEQQAPEPEAGLIMATPFVWRDPSTIPRREFLYGRHLARRYVSVTVAPGGVGKSSMVVADCLAMVTGRPLLLGDGLVDKLRVWLFNAEDPRDEMERRIAAACIHYGIGPADIGDRLFLDSGREQDLVVAIQDKAGVKIVAPIVEAVVEQLKRNRIDVMIIDPFVSTHGVPENDNGAIDKVAKLWAHIADECNVAIEVVHHVRKTSDRDASVEDSRGAVSLLAAARSARVLNRMTAAQAEQAGIESEERLSFFNVQYGKANLSPPNGKMHWHRMMSVKIGNGGSGNLKAVLQDDVGVVTRWEWPSAAAVAEKVPADAFEAIKARISAGPYGESEQAGDWAGHIVGEVLEIDTSDTAGKRRVSAMMRAWIADKQLAIERRPARPGARPRPFVIVPTPPV